jgi:DNA-binding LytR/AlgR family response regulator
MQTELRVMIVEDEPLATRRLVRLLKNLASVEVVAVAQHGREALSIMEATRPNLLLLDIQMPGIDGFDLLERMPPSLTPAVVFVTAFDRYALKAFAVRAVDYVLKPVVQQRLEAALEQARRDIASRTVEKKLAELQQLTAELRRQSRARESGYDQELWVQQRSEVVRIPVAEIDWIEAQKDYVRIHSGSRSYFSRGLIGTLEDRLDPAEFMRVHRSAIVRLDRIRAVSRGRYGVLDIDLIPGARVRVGRKYSAGVRTRLGKARGEAP